MNSLLVDINAPLDIVEIVQVFCVWAHARPSLHFDREVFVALCGVVEEGDTCDRRVLLPPIGDIHAQIRF